MEIFTRFVHPEKALSPITVLPSEAGRTISTRDGKDSAQWEYTILITEEGNEVLSY